MACHWLAPKGAVQELFGIEGYAVVFAAALHTHLVPC